MKSNLSLASMHSLSDVKLISSEFVFCTMRTSEFDCSTLYIGEVIMILLVSLMPITKKHLCKKKQKTKKRLGKN